MNSIEERYESLYNTINSEIEKLLKTGPLAQETVVSAMKYSLTAGGKRIRPILCLAFYEMCGGSQNIMPFALAIEMIHTYSLIHDDLPAMDNDDLRRGKLTCHRAYSEAIAILAGDGLLNYAFEIMSASDICPEIPPERKLRAIEKLSKASGIFGMIGGQVIDIESEFKEKTIEEITHLHNLKTGALISASAAMGVILAGGSQEEIAAAERFGKLLGLAFQVRDDVLNVVGNKDDIGKSIGSDQENGKATYTSVLGVEKSTQFVKKLNKDALLCLTNFKNNDLVKFLSLKLENRMV